ncbi:hypothetical protein OCU04_008537 [Sclerotinia nivalis]|uniref:Uncharacterized protein n=1 Tax=Sclerotinia nivalis TaxID=352851 RepID=A0A9X0AIA7_9HELO|nr:hypothetical protein OCU04_008537 [Sclerotinia nivalis]
MAKLRGVKVTFANNQKQRAICDISDFRADATWFLPKAKDGDPPPVRTTVWKHMNTVHAGFCIFPDAYCINVGSRKEGDEIWYPADSIFIASGQSVSDTNDGDLTEGLLKSAQRKPCVNQGVIHESAKKPLGILGAEGPNYSVFGLEIENRFTVLNIVKLLG